MSKETKEEFVKRIKQEGIKKFDVEKEHYYYKLYANDFPELFSETEVMRSKNG